MDSFIDKLAQRFAATDQAKAGTYADAKEIAKLKEKIEGYENLLQDIKKINLRNIESAEKLNEIAESSAKSVEQVKEVIRQAEETVKIADEKVRLADDSKAQETANKEYLTEMFDKTTDVIHKENVKVYRNVQATVQASIDDQTKSIIEAQNAVGKKNSTTFLKVMSVLIFLAVLADIALKVLTMFHII